ncbi:MAG: hypothetical protein GWO02_18525, partial [Gammaproteobacteria bacterium]|nr:hypothetical protein [Gammaproteobacteria bacterium]
MRTVIDLRHPDELQDAPSRGPLIAEHVERHHISPVPLSQTMADWIDK